MVPCSLSPFSSPLTFLDQGTDMASNSGRPGLNSLTGEAGPIPNKASRDNVRLELARSAKRNQAQPERHRYPGQIYH